MSTVVGASFDGSVAAVSSTVQELVHPEPDWDIRAGRWDGTLTDLGRLGSNRFVFATDVSSDGSTHIGFNGRRPWRWTQSGGMVGLGFPEGGNIGAARGVNRDGTIIVGAWDGPGLDIQRASIWTSTNGNRDLQAYLEEERGLDLQGWYLLEATGISDDGSTMVGSGSHPTPT